MNETSRDLYVLFCAHLKFMFLNVLFNNKQFPINNVSCACHLSVQTKTINFVKFDVRVGYEEATRQVRPRDFAPREGEAVPSSPFYAREDTTIPFSRTIRRKGNDAGGRPP